MEKLKVAIVEYDKGLPLTSTTKSPKCIGAINPTATVVASGGSGIFTY